MFSGFSEVGKLVLPVIKLFGARDIATIDDPSKFIGNITLGYRIFELDTGCCALIAYIYILLGTLTFQSSESTN